jgi:hypothetical protein
VALEHIDWDLVAELTAEIDKQRNRREGEKGYMPCVVYIHARFVKPFDLLLDAPAGRRGDDYERELHCNATTPMYFRALATPLIRGRWLAEDDEREGAPLVTLVNETLEEILPGRQCDRGRFDCSSPDRIIRVTSLFRGPPTGWLTRIADGFIGATCRGVGRSGK